MDLDTSSTALETALALLALGLWPVPITPPDDPHSAAPGKAPIGKDWGRRLPAPETLRDLWRRVPRASVGLLLGREGRVIDVEVDGARGEESLVRLLRGEIPATMGWTSARGPHHLFAWNDRLARYGKTIIKHPELPGLEIRVGAFRADDPKQLQSVCPPSPTTGGHPRRWNGVETIAELPEAFFVTLDPLLLDEPEPATPPAAAPVRAGDRNRRYAIAALERETGTLALAPEGERNNQLFRSAAALGELVAAGELTRSEVEEALHAVAVRAGLADREVRATIRSGLEAGRAHPRDLKNVGDPCAISAISAKRGGLMAHMAHMAQGDCSEDVVPEDEQPVIAPEWPAPPGDAVYHGLAGLIVRMIAPHTEADPLAILVQLLVAFGNTIGRGAHFRVESTRHCMNLYAAMVGRSSKARKGTSWDHVSRLLSSLDREWADDRIQSGLSSGEGLIWAVRDPIVRRDPVKDRGRITGYQENVVDAGVADKRLLVLETELAGTLKVMTREGNTLSPLVRQAWDSGALRSMTKNSPARASGAHVSIIGHVTRDELERSLTATEAANGFANRFLWICVRRSRSLPFGGRIHEVDFAEALRRLGDAVAFARVEAELTRSEDASRLWAAAYDDLSEPRSGLLGAVLGRAEAQALRLSCLYALLDGSAVIRPEHLEAALELWRYAERSARYIFGEALGDPDGDLLLGALRSAPGGLTRTQIRVDVFAKHKPSAEIARILGRLLEYGLVRGERIETGGRPAEVWCATPTGGS